MKRTETEMEFYELAILCMGLVLAGIVLLRKQWKAFLVSAGLGLVSLFGVNLFSFVTGAAVQISFESLATAVLLGAPGTVFRLFMGII